MLTLAVDVAQDSGATTAAEKMLAHELAAAHRLGMGLIATGSSELHKYRAAPHLNPGALGEAVKCANVGAKLITAVSQGALVLDKLRNGARQTVTVQHVTVADGGQALVAGSVSADQRDRADTA